jgi:DNA mismatch repair ATPase MutL
MKYTIILIACALFLNTCNASGGYQYEQEQPQHHQQEQPQYHQQEQPQYHQQEQPQYHQQEQPQYQQKEYHQQEQPQYQQQQQYHQQEQPQYQQQQYQQQQNHQQEQPHAEPAQPAGPGPAAGPGPIGGFPGLGGLGGLGGFPGIGLGLGLPGLGLGLPGLGLGLPGLGLGLPGLGFGFGKRSVESVERNSTDVNRQNRTICSWLSSSSLIRCVCEETVECGVEARLDEIRNVTVKLPELSIISQNVKTTENREAGVLRLVSRVFGSMRNWTLVHPITEKEVLLSIYSSPAVNEPGFFVKDLKCFDRIDSIVRSIENRRVRFSLVGRV